MYLRRVARVSPEIQSLYQLTDRLQTRNLRAKVSDGVGFHKPTQGQSKWESGARNFICLRNARAAPATVSIIRYEPDTSL